MAWGNGGLSLVRSTFLAALLKEWLPEMRGFFLVGGSCSLVLGECLQALSYGEFFCGHVLHPHSLEAGWGQGKTATFK